MQWSLNCSEKFPSFPYRLRTQCGIHAPRAYPLPLPDFLWSTSLQAHSLKNPPYAFTNLSLTVRFLLLHKIFCPALPCFAVAAFSGEQNGSNQMYYFRISNSEIIIQMNIWIMLWKFLYIPGSCHIRWRYYPKFSLHAKIATSLSYFQKFLPSSFFFPFFTYWSNNSSANWLGSFLGFSCTFGLLYPKEDERYSSMKYRVMEFDVEQNNVPMKRLGRQSGTLTSHRNLFFV